MWFFTWRTIYGIPWSQSSWMAKNVGRTGQLSPQWWRRIVRTWRKLLGIYGLHKWSSPLTSCMPSNNQQNRVHVHRTRRSSIALGLMSSGWNLPINITTWITPSLLIHSQSCNSHHYCHKNVVMCSRIWAGISTVKASNKKSVVGQPSQHYLIE